MTNFHKEAFMGRILFEETTNYGKGTATRTAELYESGSVFFYTVLKHPRRNTQVTQASFSPEELERILSGARALQHELKINRDEGEGS
jgi:hypothetical protein